ncbi:hypothetical protein HER10_EVM0004556 [Colletotrichum scovillei]|uniref:Cell wall protein n=1 Tax=Colletotrichum scovillei TaxID=1209932 RepID=A0A9P7UH79_9PEZI|nr:uncharacterized protein HER10_EVM0004556 [Colletotrichum scovillei]KAF4773787.1 hypothetical protein HER10_EVM0004556 [Colletotrichum scovillei]KAG7048550.1 cell wall protein [Colletotrichum scovillei]KAG7065712.1 cell wall protein [Colletotrichum scovillei]KAG7068314.1 cell wall protein [Colletotrichum scovillei]
MQIQSALVSLALVAGTASAYEHVYTNGTYTITKVWDAVTTYCPQPTTLCFNNRTYTIEQPTTFIIPDCPCTQTYTTNQCSECAHATGYVVPAPPAQTDVPPAVPTQTGLITCPGSPNCPPGASGSVLPPAQTGSAGVVCPGSPNCPPAASGGAGGAGGATPSQTGALVCPGSPNCPATGTAGTNGTKPTTVVVAGAEKNAAAAGVALVAGVVAVLAL